MSNAVNKMQWTFRSTISRSDLIPQSSYEVNLFLRQIAYSRINLSTLRLDGLSLAYENIKPARARIMEVGDFEREGGEQAAIGVAQKKSSGQVPKRETYIAV